MECWIRIWTPVGIVAARIPELEQLGPERVAAQLRLGWLELVERMWLPQEPGLVALPVGLLPEAAGVTAVLRVAVALPKVVEPSVEQPEVAVRKKERTEPDLFLIRLAILR